ncbi:hypothetical protein FMM06_12600 [Glacieibacterium frigidum]|uniref:Uncharacterized protein n=2 Tax=Glacieibacterium frigidum TaxID=2593303 RepID=A0A552UAQ5_9SPHN|nr:hypothetical protein FMM06_12600 [Glacieibacterium frigidum]
MVVVVIAGFSVQLAAGRSSFDAPPLVHAHALVFMGWLALYGAQAATAATGRRDWHRRVGWIAPWWMVAMVVLGCLVTLALVRRGGVPFFFTPLQFLIFDPVSLLTFAGLTGAAIVWRRQTDWHRRLHLCGMAVLLGPGLGRLLPMPLLAPYAWEATVAVSLLFPLAGAVADLRRTGKVHPAWHWGVGTILAATLLTELLTYSPAGTAIYAAVTAGSPGAAVAPLAFPPPPGG